MTTPVMDLESRTCARVGCDRTLVRNPTTNLRVWVRQRFCGPICYRFRDVSPGMEPAEPVERPCANPVCRKALVRGRGESPATFRRRAHCDQKCRDARRAAAKKRIGVRLVHPPALPPPVAAVVSPEGKWESPCAGSRESFWFDSTLKTKAERLAEEDRLRALAQRLCGPCPFRQMCVERGDKVKHGMYGAVLWRDERGKPRRVALFAPPVADRRAS